MIYGSQKQSNGIADGGVGTQRVEQRSEMTNHMHAAMKAIYWLCLVIALPSCYKLFPSADAMDAGLSFPEGDRNNDGDGDSDIEKERPKSGNTDTHKEVDTRSDSEFESDSSAGRDVEMDTETNLHTDSNVEWRSDAEETGETDTVADRETENEWIPIVGGTYQMGRADAGDRELPVHEVTVPDFEILKKEVTVAQFEACVDEEACGKEGNWMTSSYPDCNFDDSQRQDHPMNCVNWYAAVEYCTWIGGRLPAEAEWEYAARSEGDALTYPWGDAEATCDLAVINRGCGTGSTWPVCSKPLGNTKQGLCDMTGNVNEWMYDDYHADYTGAPTDGSAWITGDETRLVRGGSWDTSSPELLCASCRILMAARMYWQSNIGFRCVRSPEPMTSP